MIFFLNFISIFFSLLKFAIFIKILLSFFATGKNFFGEKIDEIVRPILRPFFFARIGVIDLAPLCAFFALNFLEKIILKLALHFF